jgi:hypothetical protein
MVAGAVFDPSDRIQVDMAAQTAIFSRGETATYEVIGPAEFRGFGHSSDHLVGTKLCDGGRCCL